VKEKIETLADFIAIAGWFFRPLAIEGEARERLAATPEAARTLTSAAQKLQAIGTWDLEHVERAVRGLPEELGVKPKAVFAALRLGMSGQIVTPGLFESLWVLGRDEAAARLTAAAALL
jgi:glutamyl-tRNA synthetase